MAKEKFTILHRGFDEVWNKGKAELIDEMITPDCIAFGLNDPSATRAVIPSATVVAYCRITATHKGAALGMQATGKSIAFEAMRKFGVSDGKVVEAWNRFDFLKMFQQMGMVRMGRVDQHVCLVTVLLSEKSRQFILSYENN